MSFVKVWFDFEERTEMLNEVEKGRLLLAMLRYAQGKELPELKGGERFLFPVFKIDIDRDATAYNTRISNGAKGGRPKAETEANLTEPNETEHNPTSKTKEYRKKNIEKEQRKENDIRARARFTAPTVDEVNAYANEKGYTGFSGQRFVDYYASKGWVVGKSPMKDWRAAVRGWVSRDSDPAKPKDIAALNYEQREYKNEDFGDDFFIDLDKYGEG